jgi:hypothetical protein
MQEKSSWRMLTGQRTRSVDHPWDDHPAVALQPRTPLSATSLADSNKNEGTPWNRSSAWAAWKNPVSRNRGTTP